MAIDFGALLIRAEWKTAEPYGIGVLSHRHVQTDRSVYIGKESNEVLDELAQLLETRYIVAGCRVNDQSDGTHLV